MGDYYVAFRQSCDDSIEYEIQFDFIKEQDSLVFTGNSDFDDVYASWYDDIEELYRCIDYEFSNSYKYDFQEDFATCLEKAESFVKGYGSKLSKYGIKLKAADIFSIIDYRQSLYNDTTCRDNIKPKLDFNIIDYNYGEEYTTGWSEFEVGEILDIADYLFDGNVEEHGLTGYSQGDYWSCFSVENNPNIFSDFDYEFIGDVIFGGLYEYRFMEVDTPNIDEVDLEELADSWDSDYNEWYTDKYQNYKELKASCGYNLIGLVDVEAKPRTTYDYSYSVSN